MQLEDFKEYLRVNTRLLPASMKQYCRTIKEFCYQYKIENSPEAATLKQMNEFISRSFREVSAPHKKYAFEPFLQWIGKQELYEELVQVRVPPRKKIRRKVERNKINQLILNIANEKHRDIAELQYACGARAHEIITLKKENIDIQPGVIRATLITKGDKERPINFNIKHENILQKYLLKIDKPSGFLFLPERAQYLDEDDLWRVVETEYHYYNTSIRTSGASIGLDFSSHDFRAAFADSLKKLSGGDVVAVKNALGQSDVRATMRYFDESPEESLNLMLEHQGGN
jgi:site-specific recombinase XerD